MINKLMTSPPPFSIKYDIICPNSLYKTCNNYLFRHDNHATIYTHYSNICQYAGSSILLTCRLLYIFCRQKHNPLQERMTNIFINYNNKIKYHNQNQNPVMSLVFSRIHVARSLVFCVVFCRLLFVLLYFFYCPLCCLFFFDLRLLITPLLSSNFSCQ